MARIRLRNTMTRKVEDFVPLDPAHVRMYVCGPTVYDRAHLGNARPVVVFDVLFRLLRHVYGEAAVTYVRNFTDVDDKINAKAAQTGRPIRDITDETISFDFGDYRYRFSLLKSVKIVAANGKDKRPIIRLDIVVDGKVLHNVEFTVNDRGGLNYDVLLGRRALAQANVLVNPALVHLSTKSLNTVDAKTDSEQSKKEEYFNRSIRLKAS